MIKLQRFRNNCTTFIYINSAFVLDFKAELTKEAIESDFERYNVTVKYVFSGRVEEWYYPDIVDWQMPEDKQTTNE